MDTIEGVQVAEKMVDPFSKQMCEVLHLQPGDELLPSDIYRSVTLAEDRTSIDPEKPKLGMWMQAGEVLDNSTIGPECNVHFIRLFPVA